MTPVNYVATSNEDVQLSVLHRLDVDGASFILSSSGSRLVVFDVEQSKIILVNDLGEEIQCFCVCAADVFVIFRNLPIPRKYTLCDREMVVKKLLAKSLAIQSAKFVLQWKDCLWPDKVINQIADSLSKSCGKPQVVRLRAELLEIMERQKSDYDNDGRSKAVAASNQPLCIRLPSGIHRVVNNMSDHIDEAPTEHVVPPKTRFRSRSCAGNR
ncbi:unnamed protein product [Strongylus vulgaris]|uniref:Uncharacterized protein n=1 Tax=Strongylus vulgaris TaxID=40348 RepID=A0A3P7ILK6_STRVU|nr:unnamed protein product [Strongylus vulgaris]